MPQRKRNEIGKSENQLKLPWELECQKMECGRFVWWKTLVFMQSKVCLAPLPQYWNGRQTALTQKFRHDNIYGLSTLKVWEMMEIDFIRPKNITFVRYLIFSSEQKKGETLEQFYNIFKELVENCDCESREEVIIRNILITNMLDDDIQRELFRDTVDPERALSIAVKMRLDSKISNESHPTTKTTTKHLVVQSMLYNTSIDFAARMHAEIKQAALLSFEQPLASVEVVAKLGTQRIVRFAPLWVGNAINVIYSIILQRFVEKSHLIHEIFVKIIASIMYNILKIQKKRKFGES